MISQCFKFVSPPFHYVWLFVLRSHSLLFHHVGRNSFLFSSSSSHNSNRLQFSVFDFTRFVSFIFCCVHCLLWNKIPWTTGNHKLYIRQCNRLIWLHVPNSCDNSSCCIEILTTKFLSFLLILFPPPPVLFHLSFHSRLSFFLASLSLFLKIEYYLSLYSPPFREKKQKHYP